MEKKGAVIWAGYGGAISTRKIIAGDVFIATFFVFVCVFLEEEIDY